MNRFQRSPSLVLAMALAGIFPGAALAGGPEPRSYQTLPGGPGGPHLFAEGVISTPDDEAGGVFSPDGKDFYFGKLNPTTTFPRIGLLCVSHWKEGKWSTPEVLPFSGSNLDFSPRLAPDGKTLYFTSSRPVEGSKVRAIRIWKVSETETGWGAPEALPAPVNSPDGHFVLGGSVTRDGTLYFASDRDEPGRLQIYKARLVDGRYRTAEKLGPEINSEFNDYDPFINADESLLFFVSAGEGVPPFRHRPEICYTGGFPYARGDIYVSRNVNGKWTKAQHLEHGVNSVADEGAPTLTPDNRHLIFSSERSPFVIPMERRITMAEFESIVHATRNGHGNIYTIPVDALELGKHE
jgi:hypothetical protein